MWVFQLKKNLWFSPHLLKVSTLMQLTHLFKIHASSSLRWLFSSIFFCKEAIQVREGSCMGLHKKSVRSLSGGGQTYTSTQGRSFCLHCHSTTAGIVFCRSSTLFLPFPHQALQQTWTGKARWEEQDSGCLVWLQSTLCRKLMKMPQSFETAV